MNNYLLEKLKSGKELKIVLISHDFDRINFMMCKSRYNNLKVEYINDNISCIEDKYNKEKFKDCDIILCISIKDYDKKVCEKLKYIASEMSKDKRVSIGYSVYTKNDIMINIFCFEGENEYNEVIERPPRFSSLILADMVLSKHDEIEFEKNDGQKILSKK